MRWPAAPMRRYAWREGWRSSPAPPEDRAGPSWNASWWREPPWWPGTFSKRSMVCESEFPGRVCSVRLDVTDGAAWLDALQAAHSRFGHVEILVNNAGVLRRMEIEEETP